MASADNHARSLVYSLQTEDGTPITAMRLSDGYINLTAMTKACKKQLHDYTRLKASQEYLQGLSTDTGITCALLVQQKHGKSNQQATWGHPELAIDVAGWCSVKFKLKVNRLVARYLKGELTTEESKEAAAHLPEVVQPVQDAVAVAEWQGKREVVKHLTKKKCDKISEVTGGKAKLEYPKVNAALVKSVAGQIPTALQKAHGFADTPRNYMPQAMLGLLSYGEHQVHAELDKAYKKFGRFLSEAEVTTIAYQVTDLVYDMCKNTGGFDTPLLTSCPAQALAPAPKKRKALTAPQKSCKQQKLIMCH